MTNEAVEARMRFLHAAAPRRRLRYLRSLPKLSFWQKLEASQCERQLRRLGQSI